MEGRAEAEAEASGMGKRATTNPLMCASLTDLYQLSMCYAYWKNGRHEDHAVFDLFYRKNPFKGEYVIFAGLSEAMSLVSSFKFSQEDVDHLRESSLPGCDPQFYDWLLSVDCSQVRIVAQEEGSVVFPRVPLLVVEGPLAVVQLLETPLLNAVNFASLIATNASRFRRAAGQDKLLLEFGLRRAQGPDGGLSASRYSVVGGFDGTSNVLAGRLFGLPVKGTHAHSYVQSYSSLEEVVDAELDGESLYARAIQYREELSYTSSNGGELAAFISYACAFPDGFLGLVDTYDPLQSGVPNFICVALALSDLGHQAIGIRLDSGDLAYLSVQSRALFLDVAKRLDRPWLANVSITASNDINEQVLVSLAEQGHSIDAFGIGTHLVTCQSQPALGCVYKLVEINGKPRIKLSGSKGKITIPGQKRAYRIIGKDGNALLDVLTSSGDPAPMVGKPILCKAPFNAAKRALVTPTKVHSLLSLVWDGREVKGCEKNPLALRSRVIESLSLVRPDVLRLVNATPYKVSVTEGLFDWLHRLWEQEVPVRELV